MKIDRLISEIMILLERGKIKVSELAEICEVAPRTVQRDLEAINMAGIPIVSYAGLNGGVGIMENYKIEKRFFSAADITALLMALGSIKTSLSGDEVASALAKVKGMIPEEKRAEIELNANRIVIDTTPWVDKQGLNDTMKKIQTAMDERLLLRFDYTDRELNKTSRVVEPYRLVFKGTRWYMDGYCRTRQAFRLFKLARIKNLTLAEENFEPREYRPSQTVTATFEDKNVVSVTVRIGGAALDWLDEIMDVGLAEKDGERWRLQIPVPDSEYGYRYLLSFGADLECIAPRSFRENMKKYLSQTLAMYKD